MSSSRIKDLHGPISMIFTWFFKASNLNRIFGFFSVVLFQFLVNFSSFFHLSNRPGPEMKRLVIFNDYFMCPIISGINYLEVFLGSKNWGILKHFGPLSVDLYPFLHIVMKVALFYTKNRSESSFFLHEKS
jgi:hypothetical protein